jgi:nicotinamide-nucleotide amidase
VCGSADAFAQFCTGIVGASVIEKAVILSTGDELTTGRVVDSNSAAIADRLFATGIEVKAVLKIGDDRQMLSWALAQGRQLGDMVIGTGGLGPTADDLTSATVAAFLGCMLKRDEQVAQALEQRFAQRGISWTKNSLKQALFPEGASIVPNPVGTAPGFRIGMGPDCTLIWLSGVPEEMIAMMDESVVPWIEQQRLHRESLSACTFKIYGLSEGKLDDLMGVVDLRDDAKLSFRAHYPDLSLRLTVRSEQGSARFENLRTQIREILADSIYAEDDAPLEEIVGRLLLENNRTLALAESCTGGYISHRITRIAGSSGYYYGGAVTYSNEAKMLFLGVPSVTLQQHGAVSRETALAMSRGIRERTGAHIGLSVTGVAGPGGGSPEKPVGTVWVSMIHGSWHEARLFRFAGDRERIIAGTSQAALNWLRTHLLKTQVQPSP